jgi:protein archease
VHRWLDHTAELELELEAPTEHEVLSDALVALTELLEEGGSFGNSLSERRAITAVGTDRPALLAAWLEELLFLSESAGFIPTRIEELSLQDETLTATVAGRLGNPRPLVKAVTYHRLQFEPSERGYRARVVFDV